MCAKIVIDSAAAHNFKYKAAMPGLLFEHEPNLRCYVAFWLFGPCNMALLLIAHAGYVSASPSSLVLHSSFVTTEGQGVAA